MADGHEIERRTQLARQQAEAAYYDKLRDVSDALDGQFAYDKATGEPHSIARAVQQQREALDAAQSDFAAERAAHEQTRINLHSALTFEQRKLATEALRAGALEDDLHDSLEALAQCRAERNALKADLGQAVRDLHQVQDEGIVSARTLKAERDEARAEASLAWTRLNVAEADLARLREACEKTTDDVIGFLESVEWTDTTSETSAADLIEAMRQLAALAAHPTEQETKVSVETAARDGHPESRT